MVPERFSSGVGPHRDERQNQQQQDGRVAKQRANQQLVDVDRRRASTERGADLSKKRQTGHKKPPEQQRE